MSESPAPSVAENTAESHSQTLTAEAIEAVLAEFRGWLTSLAATATFDEAPSEPLDLHTLLAQFTALRHEVNLRTKATRAQQEQSGETLRQLSLAVEALVQAQTAAQQTQQGNADERLRPLLKSLIELHDAVSLAGREMSRMQDTVLPLLAQLANAFQADDTALDFDLERLSSPPSWWSRWFGRRASSQDLVALKRNITAQLNRQRERSHQAGDNVARVRQLLASLATGYTMSLQRVERTLRQHGLEPIAAVGQSFDPEKMEVVEAVAGSGRPNGEVLDEVRRGYLWNGRVFRFAQVRVAKS
jgi:molecular chaperone GrpE